MSLTPSQEAAKQALTIFEQEYVPNAEGASYHAKWLAANKNGDAPKWVAFRDAILAGGSAAVPVMATKYGRALVAAGKEHMGISRVAATMVPPYPVPGTPPPPGGGGGSEPYPASFFTGPLGLDNIVPNDPAGGILILWTGIGGNPAGEQGQRDLILQRMSDCGRVFDGIQFQTGQLDVGGQSAEDWVHSLGSLPCFAWNTFSSPATILSGANNGTIDAMADRFKNKSYRVMVRLMHEFDLSHLPYFPHGGAAQWVQAWRFIVDRVKARVEATRGVGNNNIGFWWCPTEQAGDPQRALIDACWPGSLYVDWSGSDLYNNVGGFSSPIHGGWAEFDEILNYDKYGFPRDSICTQHGIEKPYVVGEVSSRFDDADTNRKGNWFRNMDLVSKPNAPNLRGIAFFDTDTQSGEWNDWRVDHDQTFAEFQAQQLGSFHAATYQGFKDLVVRPRWTGGIRPALP